MLDTLDRVVIDAIASGKDVLIDPDKIFHLKRPQMGTLWKGWGTPMILPVLKDIHYYYILRKANEALALQRIVPLNILFPQGNADVSPFAHLNLGTWKAKIEDELLKWRRDGNYLPILPLPVGSQIIGGDAKQLMVSQEQEMVARSIAAGLGVPLEFIIGGLNWSGSSVSLRILENFFLNLTSQDLRLTNKFLIPKLARIMRIPKIEISFTKFKMADDMQAKSNAYNLMQSGYVSRKSVLEQDGFDSDKEITQMEQEHITVNRVKHSDMIAQQEIQNVLQIMSTRNQILAGHEADSLQKVLMEESQGKDKEQLKVKISDLAEKYALMLLSQDKQLSSATLEKMKTEMPNLYSLVIDKIRSFTPEIPKQASVLDFPHPAVPQQEPVTQETSAPGIGEKATIKMNLKPMPEKKPPRRKIGGV